MKKIILLSFLVLLAGIGCGRKTVIETGAGTITQIDTDEITITDTKTGTEMTFNTSELPDNFPNDIPVMPQARIKTSGVYPGGASVGYETEQSVSESIAWHTEAMTDKGWTLSMRQQLSAGTMMYWGKTDGSSAILTIGAGEGDSSKLTQVTLITSGPQPTEPSEQGD
ncbi:MAG: hypothetical protein AAB932_04280 [Patescibacteria group bacterium]